MSRRIARTKGERKRASAVAQRIDPRRRRLYTPKKANERRTWDIMNVIGNLSALAYNENKDPSFLHENSIADLLHSYGFLEISVADTLPGKARRKGSKATLLHNLSLKTRQPISTPVRKETVRNLKDRLAKLSPLTDPKAKALIGRFDTLDSFLLGSIQAPSRFKNRFPHVNEFPCGTFMQQPFGSNSWPDFIIKVHPQFVLYLEAKSTKDASGPKYNSSQVHRNILYVFSRQKQSQGDQTTFYMGNSVVRTARIPVEEIRFRDQLKAWTRAHELYRYLEGGYHTYNPYRYNCGNPRPTFETSVNYFNPNLRRDAEQVATDYVRLKSSWDNQGDGLLPTTWNDRKCDELKETGRLLPEVTRVIEQATGRYVTFDTAAQQHHRVFTNSLLEIDREDQEVVEADEDQNDTQFAGIYNSVRRNSTMKKRPPRTQLAARKTDDSSQVASLLRSPSSQRSSTRKETPANARAAQQYASPANAREAQRDASRTFNDSSQMRSVLASPGQGISRGLPQSPSDQTPVGHRTRSRVGEQGGRGKKKRSRKKRTRKKKKKSKKTRRRR